MNAARIMNKAVSLSDLLAGEVALPAALDVKLTGLELDSRKIEAGDLFLACKGNDHDGRDYIDDVLEKGVAAILVERDAQYVDIVRRDGVPLVPVANLVVKLGKIAARFFDHPAKQVWLIGITGTNGKTSTCQFIAQFYSLLEKRSALCGTLGYGMFGEELSSLAAGPGTTPDAIALQHIIKEMTLHKADVMTMEVSSHGLEQKRVNVEEFDAAVFTNLSRDHLDYHGSMQAYGEAKRKLFSSPDLKLAVLNLDDIYSASILNGTSRNVETYTYSLSNTRAKVYAKKLNFHANGFVMHVVTPWGEGEIRSSLLGAFNASNLLAALTTVLASQAELETFDFNKILMLASKVEPVQGRMEVIGEEAVTVVVDYAHTPDGLKTALQALRQHYQGNIWCVFGCGGNRDQGKRPLMASVAEQLADHVVLTDDNPRLEASAQIIQHILSGFSRPDKVYVEGDRAKAIDYALASATEGDVVLIAGKGHEDYQDVGGNRMAFSDVKQARLGLQHRFKKCGVGEF